MIRRNAYAVLAGVWLWLNPADVDAQTDGGTVVSTRRILPTWLGGHSTFHLAPEFAFDLGGVVGDASGFIGAATQSTRRTEGDLVVAWGIPAIRGFRVETEFGGFRTANGPDFHTYGARGGARLLHTTGNGIAWIGGALSSSWNENSRRSARNLHGGGWRMFGSTGVGLSFRSVDYNDDITLGRDTVYTIVGFPFRSRRTEQIAVDQFYFDTELLASRQVGPVVFHLGTGVRLSRQASHARRSWIRAGAELPVMQHLAVQVAAGQRPSTPDLRIEAGSFATVGFRWSMGGADHSRPPVDLPSPASGEPSAELRYLSGGKGQELVIHNLRGGRVEIMGDVTDWLPRMLVALDGQTWSVVLRLRPGTYRVNLRVDGGEWRALPGYPTMRDEFGGTVGVIVIEG